MSASRTIPGAARAGSNEGWTSEFDRVFRLPARIRNAKVNGVSTSGSVIAPQAPPKSMIAQSRVRAVAAVLPSAGWWLVTVGVVLILAFAAALAASLPAKRSTSGDWTVVTMARDGSWGVATASSLNHAIPAAIRDCRAMRGTPNGCGAQFEAIRTGWALGSLCGDHRIIATGSSLRDAEAAARQRETDVRRQYVPDLQPCRRVLIVEPGGFVTLGSARNSLPNPSEPQME